MPTFDCPACGHPADASPNNVGRRTQCPECGHTFVIPSVGTYIPPSGPDPDLDLDDDHDTYHRDPYPTPPPYHRRRHRTRKQWFAGLDHHLRIAIILWIISAAIFLLAGLFFFVAMGNFNVSLTLLSVVFFWISLILNFVAMLFFGAWMIRDARARGSQSPEIWIIVLLFSWNIGVIVYLLSRPPGRLEPCSRCGELQLPRLRRCPHCGD